MVTPPGSTSAISHIYPTDGVEQLVEELRSRPKLPEGVLKDRSEHPHPLVRASVVARSDYPDRWLERMFRDTDRRVRIMVSRKPGAPRRVLETLADDDHWAVRAFPRWRLGWSMTLREVCEYAEHTDNHQDLERLLSHPSREVRRTIALRRDLPDRLNQALADDLDWYVRQHLLVASNPLLGLPKPLPVWLLEKLADDPSWLVRRQLAIYRHCPDSLIEKLSEDRSPWVRQAVSGRLHLPADVLERLEKDPNRKVLLALKRRQAKVRLRARLSRRLKPAPSNQAPTRNTAGRSRPPIEVLCSNSERLTSRPSD